METKTCRFGIISDSATRSTSCWRFFNICFRFGESLTLLPFKPLILTPPAKIVDNRLPLQFFRKFFFLRIPDLIRKLNNNKTASRNKMSIKFYIRQWVVKNVRTITMVKTCPKKVQHAFMFSLDQYKKRAWCGSVLQVTCGLPEKNQISSQVYCN